MTSNMTDGGKIRQRLLEILKEQDGNMQSTTVLNEAVRRLPGVLHNSILTTFGDFFRTGHIGWGQNIANPNPPWIHLTDQGRRALEHLSRDPYNPDGYLAYLRSKVQLSPIADAYVREALRTYVADCFKASAVMIGVASEQIVLEVRDHLVLRIQSLGQAPNSNLKSMQVLTVLTAITNQLTPKKNTMPKDLAERFDAYWSSFIGQIRMARNEAGHPNSIEPVTHETVHASLLIFPELAMLAATLSEWIDTTYV